MRLRADADLQDVSLSIMISAAESNDDSSDISISKRYVHPSEDAVLLALSKLNVQPNERDTQEAIRSGEKSENRQLPATISATPGF